MAASSKLEAHHIRACLGDIASQVSIASDLPPLPSSSLVGITANSKNSWAVYEFVFYLVFVQ